MREGKQVSRAGEKSRKSGHEGRWAGRSRALALATLVTGIGMTAGTAQAAPLHREALEETAFPLAAQNKPCGTVVDNKGDVYLSTRGDGKVSIYSSTGAPITSFTAAAGGPEPCGLAVDSKGELYVEDRFTNVYRYHPSAYPPTATTTYTPEATALVGAEASAVAVNPTNDHVLVDEKTKAVEFDSAANGNGELNGAIGEGILTESWGIDVYGANGEIYVNDHISNSANRVYVLNSVGDAVLNTITGTNVPNFPAGFHAPFSFSTGTLKHQMLAVDQNNGHVLVANAENTSGGNGHRVIDEFDAQGNFVTQIGGVLASDPNDVAIDNSGTPTNGNLYATSGANASGELLGYGPLEPIPHRKALEETAFPLAAQNKPCGTVVDNKGDVYLSTRGDGKVSIYSSTGAPITSFTAAAGGPEPCGLAVDSKGELYVEDRFTNVYRYHPSAYPPTATTTYTPEATALVGAEASAVAVNPTNDHVLVDEKTKAVEFDSAANGNGELNGAIGEGILTESWGIDVYGANGEIYVNDHISNSANRVYVLNSAGDAVLSTITGTNVPNFPAGFHAPFSFSTGTLKHQMLAVDQNNGHVLVANAENTSGGNGHRVIDEFDAQGNFVTQIGGVLASDPNDVAIDNSGTPTNGNLYATSGANASGELLGYGPLEPIPHRKALEETAFPLAAQNKPCGTVVDNKGDVYLSTRGDGKVSIYSSTGAPITSFTAAAGGPEPCGLAVDSKGELYVEDRFTNVYRYHPSAYPPTATTTYTPEATALVGAEASAVAVNPTNDHVLVDEKTKAVEFDSAANGNGELNGAIGEGILTESWGIDVYGANGEIYVNDHISNSANRVYVLNSVGDAVLNTITGTNVPNFPAGFHAPFSFSTGTLKHQMLAVDQNNGHVLVANAENTSGGNGHRVIDEFDAQGNFVTQIGGVLASDPNDVAIDNSGTPTNGNLYATSGANASGELLGYGPLDYPSGIPLTVAKTGTGDGTVTSSPAGIDCGTECSHDFETDEEVILSAAPDSHSRFTGWTGCEEEPSPNECKLTMDEEHEVSASFAWPKLKVVKSKTGTGKVTSTAKGANEEQINCGSHCEESFPGGEPLLLTATPEGGSILKEWSGCDEVPTQTTCKIAPPSETPVSEVTATFAAKPLIAEQKAYAHDTCARLEAKINPESEDTHYHFEYTTQAGFEAEGFLGAQSVPVPAGTIPSGEAAVAVFAVACDLTPGAAYRFRAVAFNSVGYTEGAALAFNTHATASAGLPDNRAYEQATPVDKDGGDATGTAPFVKAAADGDGVTFGSTSGIPGGEGAQELSLFLASRTSDGWFTQGLLPPGDTGQKAGVRGWTPDFAEVFARATKLGEPRQTTFLARPSDGRPIATIAPYTANASFDYAGASKDGSVAVFESTSKLTPDALEGHSNVYAWDREAPPGEQLHLAGTMNTEAESEAQLGEGAFGGPYDWVSGTSKASLQRGGSASSYYTQDEHAVAADGSVFFTGAGTGQLYERLNPTESQSPLDGEGHCEDPAKACTVHVSASERTIGIGPGGHDGGGPQPAAFAGATADGTKAFFTSAELLTDDANTGPEHLGAAIARAKLGATEAEEVKLSFLPTSATAVDVDGGYVYWVEPEGESIGRAKLGATEPEEIDPAFIPRSDLEVQREVEPGVFEGFADIQGVAVLDELGKEYVYWTNAVDGEEGHGTIGRAELSGANPEPELIEGAYDPRGIDASAEAGHEYVYWVNAGYDTGNGSGYVGRAGLAGGSPQQEFIKFASGDVAVNGTTIYFSRTNGSDGFIRQGSIADGTENGNADVTVSGAKSPPPITLDGSHLYFANPNTSVIGRSNLDGSAPVEYAKGAGNPKGLAVDATHLYWSANQEVVANPGNDLYRYSAEAPEGERLTDLIPDSADLNGIEVQGVLGISKGGDHVYLAANGVPAGIGNSPNEAGEEAKAGNCKGTPGTASGECNLYMWHEDPESHASEVVFVVRLDASGGTDGDTANWSASREVSPSDTFQKTARVSSDGTLLFRSRLRLTPYDSKGTSELYRYQPGDAGSSCVSCDPSGAAPTGQPFLGTIELAALIPAPPALQLSRVLSSSGNQAFFETTDALVAGDVNGDGGCPATGSGIQHGTGNNAYRACQDVYEWEAPGAGTCTEGSPSYSTQDKGCLYLISTGKEREPSFLLDASESGNDVFIFTRSQLVEQDKDELIDVYDARVNGGIAAQSEAAPPPCESAEACHGPETPQPAQETPPSASFAGPPNPVPHRHRAKKRHAKRRHHHHRRHRHRHRGRHRAHRDRAHANRGAKR